MDDRIEEHWRTWAEIDLGALRHNFEVARSHAGGADVIAVVKADAYGLGLERISRALGGRAAYFGVAALSEAQTISAALGEHRTDILLLGAILPDEMEVAIERGWHFMLSTLEELRAASSMAQRCGACAQVHLAVDTGMGRIGALESEFVELCQAASRDRFVRVQGLATHLPSADEDEDFTVRQLESFDALIGSALRCWADQEVAPKVHVLNSAGVFRHGEGIGGASALIRPGLMLYGIAPEGVFQDRLRPVVALKTRVRLVRFLPGGRGISYGRTYITERPTRVATLGIGYGDGYPRNLSGRGAEVLIHGRRCPLLGRVTMDQIMVDVTSLPEPVAPGDEVVVYGAQGSEEISSAEIAEKAGTIPWEILTRLTNRVCRVSTGCT